VRIHSRHNQIDHFLTFSFIRSPLDRKQLYGRARSRFRRWCRGVY